MVTMKDKKSKRFAEAEKMAHEIKRGMAKKFWKDIAKLRKERSKSR